MIYQGKSLWVDWLENGIVQLCLDAEHAINKFDRATLTEFGQAISTLASTDGVQALVLRSNKDAFIVGADITEFLGLFAQPTEQLADWLIEANRIFSALEDLPFPTVSAINGYALGGGCETILATDLRLAASNARIGLPETKLGIMPGFGGTVRLPRVIGADNAMEWITSGRDYKAADCLKVGAVDAIVEPDNLSAAALQLAQRAAAGEIDWQRRRQRKLAPLTLSQIEAAMSFTTAKAMVAQQAGPHYPAPMMAVKTIERAAGCSRAKALDLEREGFVQLAKSPQAEALIGLFLNDQWIKAKAKSAAKQSHPIDYAAVLGAGIMGGGIAYQSALTGTPITMKDIRPDALELGLNEASKLLNKRVERGRMRANEMAAVLNRITPALGYEAVKPASIIVEAVVENPKVKQAVLAELESQVADDTVITSNTSSIRIDLLAQALQKPERFCGMHFFNPVHQMPLVEVIRGQHTSDETVATVVAWAAKMGKSPIVVNDCPGFLVNRVLFPYLAGFAKLVSDGVDISQIDKVMEKQFGWPMGPAYLLDVVGIDTAHHAQQVMAEGFPERMSKSERDVLDLMFEQQRFGQKNGQGFYRYEPDSRGKPKKLADPGLAALLSELGDTATPMDAEAIIARMMVPMINETVRCLEEGIVASAAEADMALVYGLGFPPFRGGVFRYLDQMGLANYVAMADGLRELGPLYEVTDKLRSMAAAQQTFYSA